MLLATFNYNNKEYVYSIVNNKIEYGYKVNDCMYNDITDEEKNLMNKIYTKFVISKDSINHKRCGIINYNNKVFQIMYDKVSKRKFFYEINNNYVVPIYEDFLYLENKLNPDVLYNQNGNSFDSLYNKKKVFKYIIVGTCVLSISTYAYYTTIQNIINNNLENDIAIETEVESDELVFAIDDLKETLSNNSYLSSNEKEFVLSGFSIIEENIDYIDLELINSRLKDLKIVYKNEAHYSEDGITINGTYTKSNVITIYNCKSYEDAIKNHSSTMYHELDHVFTSRFISLGDKINEAMNEIMNLEYHNINSKDGISDLNYTNGSYLTERKAVYLLIELLGSDVLRKFYFTNSSQVLIDSLMDIIDDESKAYELIGMIDNLSLNYREKLKQDLTIMGELKALKEVYEPFNSLVNEYFIAKYGFDMMEDEIMQLYVYKQVIGIMSKPNCMIDFELEARVLLGEDADMFCQYVIPYFSDYRMKLFDGEPKQYIKYYSGDDNNYDEVVYYFQADRKQLSQIK